MPRRIFAPLALIYLLLVPQTVRADGEEERAAERRNWVREAFSRLGESRSLFFNAKAVASFAHSDEERVVQALLNTYLQPADYQVARQRYLLANGIYGRFSDTTFVGLFGWQRSEPRVLEKAEAEQLVEALQKLGKNPQCCWLAYQVARVLVRQHETDALLELLGARKTPSLLKAVLLEALAEVGGAALDLAVAELAEHKFKKNAWDAVLLESWSWAVCRASAPLVAAEGPLPEPHNSWLERLVELLDSKRACLPRSQEAVRLAMQHCFGSPRPYRSAELWRQAVELGEDPFRGDDEDATAVRFMGIDTSGERIIFLVDASDSMLNALDASELEALQRPVTGGDKGYEIDWSRVQTRFDAAREHVKYTLSRLEKDVRVAVILFGEQATPLDVTPGFVELSKSRRKAIFASLDAVVPGPVDDQHPLGRLKGQTNYLAALLTAFRLEDDSGRTVVAGEQGPPREDEHYAEALLLRGAQTIYLLSDGAPNMDKLPGRGPKIEMEFTRGERCGQNDEGARWIPPMAPREATKMQRLDKETGVVSWVDIPAYPGRDGYWLRMITETRASEPYFQNGPFAENRYQDPVSNSWLTIDGFDELLHELERLNLLRKCRIHCIGIGEAKLRWLQAIARIGRGQVVFLAPGDEPSQDAP